MKKILLISCMLFSGCITTNKIEVDTVKSWEGHYMSEKDFKQATTNIVLEKDESIWVLSNRTLNRVLKNIERK